MNYKILFLSVIIFCMYFSGCETAKTQYVEPDKIPKDEVIRITGVFLRSGDYVDVSENNASVSLDGESRGISFDDNSNKRVFIGEKDIAQLKIEILKNNYWVPVYVVGGAIVTFVILIMIFPPKFGPM
ncbi:MAG: hypothetical protein ACHQJ4_03990 [Ignavibacteria bacterium]